VQPDPPPITITDPNAQPYGGDVLGDDHDPWRPSRKQALLTAAVLVLAGVLAGGVAWDRHASHERALDREAVAQVSVSIQGVDLDADGKPTVNVVNDGPDALRVQKAQLLLPGYRELDLNRAMPRFDIETFVVSNGLPCTPRLLQPWPNGDLRLVLTTHRGQRIVRVLPLPPDAADLLHVAARDRCGYEATEDALTHDVLRIRAVGHDLELTYRLGNRSVLPLAMTSIGTYPGLALTGIQVPLTVPPASAAGSAPELVTVTIRVHVRDCRAFLDTFHANRDPVIVIDATVQGPTGSTVLGLFALNSYDDGLSTSGRAGRWAADQCPGY
jgi:hypothetical protein